MTLAPGTRLGCTQRHYSVERGYVPRISQNAGAFAAMLARNGERARAIRVLQPLMDALDAYGGPRGLFTY